MMPRGRLGTACIIVAFFGVALGFTGLILQAAHILPAGESAAKTRFAILFSTVCAAFWFLTAASVREFRWSGGTRMPIWWAVLVHPRGRVRLHDSNTSCAR